MNIPANQTVKSKSDNLRDMGLKSTYEFRNVLCNYEPAVEAYLKRKLFLEYFPKILCIEPTNICNFCCLTCFSGNRAKGYLTIEFLNKILKENSKLINGQTIWLHFAGESLIHPEFEEMIWLLNRHNVRCMVSSNCSLLSSCRTEAILNTPLFMIVFSLDAFFEKSFCHLRSGGNFAEVKSNVLNFLHSKMERMTHYPLTQAQLVYVNQSQNEIFRFVSYWSKTAVNTIHIKRYSPRSGQVRLESKEVRHNLKSKTLYPCFDLWRHLVILWDGSVVPCCTDLDGKLIIGNVRDSSLEELWNNSMITHLRKAHLTGQGLPYLCLHCFDHSGGFAPKDLADFIYLDVHNFTPQKLSFLLRQNWRHIILGSSENNGEI